MIMQVIPAIDIRDGKCVRLMQGDFNKETIYGEDPIQMALHWESFGAELIHIVDLDGAKTGVPQNLDIIAEIARTVNIPIQMGGGIRSVKTVNRVLNLGISRVIIGTSAALDTDLSKELFDTYGDKVIVGIDAKDGWVTIHGWQKTINKRAIDFAKEMESLGAKRIIHTDVSRDGLMEGVNINAMREIADAVNIPVIASGGVTNLEDICNLKALEPYGIEGVIVGKALYTGAIDLREAIAIGKK